MLSRKTVCLVSILVCGVFFGCGQRTTAPNPIEDVKLLLFQGKHDEAIAKCDELIRIDDRDFQAFIVRGQVHEKLDDLQSALADYSSAIEAAPRNPEAYSFRCDVYMELAERTTDDDDEAFRLQTLASADYQSVKNLDPEAQTAFKNEYRRPNPILDQPIPQAPDEYAKKNVVEEDLFAKDDKEDKQTDNPFAMKGDKPTPDTADENAEDEGAEKDKVNAADFAVGQAQDAADIREKELGDGSEDELILPPHEDPETATVPPLPERPITRFSLPTDNEGRLVLPQRSRSITTGLSSAPGEPDESAQGDEAVGPNNRFFLQNQALGGTSPYSLGLPNQQGVRTGIGSSQPTAGGGLGPRVGGLQIGFMPPEARSSFGPRLGMSLEQQQSTEQRQRPALPTQPENGTAILTTALPGTTMFFGGGRGAVPNTGNANLGQLTPGGMLQNGMTRSISDPSYTPFGARPALPKAKPFPATRSGTSSSN